MKITTIALVLSCAVLSAQTPAQQNRENSKREAAGLTPIYRVTVTARTAKAISYKNRSGSTKIDFSGTSLMPKAHGEAKVESKKGYTEIEVEFRDLPEANQFGVEYLTYVLWAITPEGRTSNLGEVLRNGTSGKLDVTTELQTFGLVVTAEPYFAVSRPSDVVVMENVVRPDTIGKIELIDAKYELLERGQYEHLANVLDLKVNRKLPLELYEARNAIQIARTSGADRFATETFQKAEDNLKQAETERTHNNSKKTVTTSARQAVQIAEDARAIAVKRQDDDLLTKEREAGANRELRAVNGRAAAEFETGRITQEAADARSRADAEAARVKRDNDAQATAALTEADRLRRDNNAQAVAAQFQANRLKQENDAQTVATAVATQAEVDRLKRENETQLLAAQSEANRVKRDTDAQQLASQSEAEQQKRASDARLSAALLEADRLRRSGDSQIVAARTEANRLKLENDAKAAVAQTETDRLKAENDAQRVAAQTDLDRVSKEKRQLEVERTELRASLLLQFNAILQTRDTARGLIVNMSGVLFDTGKFGLRPAAREKLAKISGIIAGHPGLRLDVEGHTDNVGGDNYNQQLSEQRGSAVRDYLTEQGMAKDSVTTKGFGKTMPVATNDTAAGRQQNRRVELVISGDAIGAEIVPIASR